MWVKQFDLAQFELIKYVDRVTSRHERIELFGSLAPHWSEVSSFIGLSATEIKTIRGEGMGKPPRNCLTEVLERWGNDDSLTYPATWTGVYQFLKDSKRGGLAKKLQAAIDAEISTFHHNYKGTSEDRNMAKD